ncbi:MAG: ATP-binding protein [Candidatus Margulisiibacteriota bacterium]|jgi:signal transduction histidine kinase
MLFLEQSGLDKDLYEKMQQMIKIIWSAVPVAILIIISLGVSSQTYASFDALIRPIYFIVGGSLFLSVFFGILIRTKKYLELQVYLTHLSFIFICIIGMHYSGGIESPLYVVILIFFLFSSVIIPSNMSIALSTICSVLYVLLISAEYYQLISHVSFVHSPTGAPITYSSFDQVFLVIVRISLFYLVAIVPGYLSGILKEKNMKLELLYKELQETQEQMIQSEKLASVGHLLSGITHEIKNPLTSILGFSELCASRLKQTDKELNRPELADFVSKIVMSTKHCVSVVQNLLDFARSSEKHKDNFQPVNVNNSVEDVLKIVEHQIFLQNIKIIRSLKPDLPSVLGNDSELRQVFLNIIINAKDAMPNGGRLTIISTNKPNDPNSIEVKFMDTGCGIIQGKLDKIFDPFFTTKEKGKGTGLGLSVSYGIIKNHYGQIDVQSTENTGSIFTVTLPAMINEQKIDHA